jgi:Zn-dependent M28 family amino/carboxypeptidase
MPRLPRIFALTLGSLAAAGLARAQHGTVEAEAIRAHVEFLADDLLEGRLAGSRGYDIAARYVAAQFGALRLEPAGDDGTWLQTVPLLEATRDAPAATFRLHKQGSRQSFEPLEHFVPGVDYGREAVDVSGEIVFVGYGVTAPELDYDDFAGIDARGKIGVVLTGAPPRFSSSQRAHYGSGLVKNPNLVAHGLIGTIGVSTPVDEKRFPWERVVQTSWVTGMRWLDAAGRPVNAFPDLRASIHVSRPVAQKLFEGAARTLEDTFTAAERSEPQAFVLPGRVSLASRTRHRRLASSNVVARLPGSDPALRDEAIVFTAHLDHVGIGAPVAGDAIYNGAMDNATGIGVMLEAARALTSLPVAPRRSILFVALTAEEKGLLGADYFVAHPPIPAGRIVANINMDMPVATVAVTDLVAFGAEHSTLGAVARRAVEAEGMALTPDPWPEESIFVRSDQYAFVRRGIPALYLETGMRARDADVDGAKVFEAFLRDRYHQPSDDLKQPIDYPTLATLARVNLRIALEVGNAPETPRWNAGDFFGSRFGRERMAE